MSSGSQTALHCLQGLAKSLSSAVSGCERLMPPQTSTIPPHFSNSCLGTRGMNRASAILAVIGYATWRH